MKNKIKTKDKAKNKIQKKNLKNKKKPSWVWNLWLCTPEASSLTVLRALLCKRELFN